MKCLLTILTLVLFAFQANAQWETAQLSEVPSQTGTAIYAKGSIDNNNSAFIVWENDANNLYFASRDVSGNWSLPELISENVINQSASIDSKGDITYISYFKTSGSNIELWLAQIEAPFTLISNEMIISDETPKASLDLAVDSFGNAHLAWSMQDTADEVVRVYYYNNTEIGLILGANKIPLSNMKQNYNDVSIDANSDGTVEIAYIGEYLNNQQIVQRVFNNEISSTAWNYGTYFDFGPSLFNNLKTDIKDGVINYISQEENGEITFFQAQSMLTDAWIPEDGNATVIATEGTLESVVVSSSINRHCSIMSDSGELQYAFNTNDTDWLNTSLLSDAVYASGNLAIDNTGEFYWLGVRDGQVVLYGPETTSQVKTFEDYGINLYPNPAVEVVHIEAQNPKEYTIKIYDMQGRMILTDYFVKKWSYEVEDWQTGIYFAQIRFKNETVSHKLFVR